VNRVREGEMDGRKRERERERDGLERRRRRSIQRQTQGVRIQ
jgi:hypothetical protein